MYWVQSQNIHLMTQTTIVGLKIETKDGGLVEIRPDHGISGGYKSDSKYLNLDSLNGSVNVVRNNEDVLYYELLKKSDA